MIVDNKLRDRIGRVVNDSDSYSAILELFDKSIAETEEQLNRHAVAALYGNKGPMVSGLILQGRLLELKDLRDFYKKLTPNRGET